MIQRLLGRGSQLRGASQTLRMSCIGSFHLDQLKETCVSSHTKECNHAPTIVSLNNGIHLHTAHTDISTRNISKFFESQELGNISGWITFVLGKDKVGHFPTLGKDKVGHKRCERSIFSVIGTFWAGKKHCTVSHRAVSQCDTDVVPPQV